MIFDPLVQWGLRHFFIKYGAKRRRQLASLGRGRGIRLKALASVSFEGRRGRELHFAAEGGARLVLAVLEPGLLRVAAMPEGKPRLERSWAVCGPRGDTPVEGRMRDDYSAFPEVDFSLEEAQASLVLETSLLRVEIGLSPFRLVWRDSSGALLASDAPEGGFAFEEGAQARALRHGMVKSRQRFYGFGEKSGLLNKNGRRLVMMDIDAHGLQTPASRIPSTSTYPSISPSTTRGRKPTASSMTTSPSPNST